MRTLAAGWRAIAWIWWIAAQCFGDGVETMDPRLNEVASSKSVQGGMRWRRGLVNVDGSSTYVRINS
jgi:hypothetical protein